MSDKMAVVWLLKLVLAAKFVGSGAIYAYNLKKINKKSHGYKLSIVQLY